MSKKTPRIATALFTIALLVLTIVPQSLLSSGGFSADTAASDTISSFLPSNPDSPPQNLGGPLPANTTSYLWWNTNWHYRIMHNVTGTGNVSIIVNFTALLATLQVLNESMENATIRVIRYHQNGSVAETITTYEFRENSSFHDSTSASGVLTWRVPTSGVYYVYFDVTANKGHRSGLNETKNLSASGDAHIVTTGSAEGWWMIPTPLATYYLLNTQVSFIVNTTAKAHDVHARFYRNGNPSFNGTFLSIDALHWAYQTKFLTKGNWTVTINASDDAGYDAPMLTADFFAGNPDLALTKLTITPTQHYRAKPLTIKAFIYCVNATLSNVNVSLFLDGKLSAHQDGLVFQETINTTVTFTWTPTKKGSVNLTVIVDPKNAIPESNERNNRLSDKNLTILGLPDLGVANITVPAQAVTEGSPATITALITNAGDENATNYRVNLYMEQTNTNFTYLESVEKNYTYVTVPAGHSMNVSLVWGQVQYGSSQYYGRWVAGIKILTNDTKPDSDMDNNTLVNYNKRLKVVLGEHTPPEVTLLVVPQMQEQRNPAQFLITATDDSGVDKVTIAIKNPHNKYTNGTMTPLVNNQYQYIFGDTMTLGSYVYTITATDGSFNKNKKTVNGGFFIIADRTPPTISFADAFPPVQLSNGTVELSCIASDLSGITTVDVTIVLPDGHNEVHAMRNASSDTKYVYTGRFTQLGEYHYAIKVVDPFNNQNTTELQVFWITHDLNDTDNDGMPDSWETKYGFDPYDPSDAALDADQDGITNLGEYKASTNPLAKETGGSSGSLKILGDNAIYIMGLVLVCVVIGMLVLYRSRKKN